MLAVPTTVFLGYYWNQNRNWVPRNAGRSVSIRRFESLLLLLGLACFGILWVYEGLPTSGVPHRFSTAVSQVVRADYYWAVMLGTSLGLVAVIVAWRVNTSIAVASLLIAGLTGGVALQTKINYQTQQEWQQRHLTSASNAKSQANLVPVKLRFELIDQLAGGDLWINGTHLGKTPYETTDQELFSKVTPWSEQEARQFRNSRNPEDEFLSPRGEHIGRWGWCPLHFVPRSDQATKLYYRVDLNGSPGYSALSRQRSKGALHAADAVQVITLDTVFPKWELAIETLLDRARLNDYEVDAAWLKAFASYGVFATNRLEQALKTEPELEKIRLRRIRMENGMEEITDSALAWAKLMQIEQDARTSRHYDSAGPAGLTVDLLVPLLDSDQLITHAIQLLKSTPHPDPASYSYGKNQFATADEQFSSTRSEVALFPIAHAVWRMDQRFDQATEAVTVSQHDAKDELNDSDLERFVRPDLDNPIEQRITPVLMRLSYTNPSRLHYADILGGSTYEHFLLRNDWRSRADETVGGPHIGDFENTVNRWFQKLLWLRSPLGRAFREQQVQKVLTLARGGLTQFALSSGSLSGDLDFLFLDREFSAEKPSLGMRFWPELDVWARSAPDHASGQILRMRWDYLARLWPESTPEMFSTAFQQATQSEGHVFIPNLPESLDAETQFDILQAVLTVELTRVAKLPADPKDKQYDGPKSRGEQIINDLRNRIDVLPCEATARLLIVELTSNPSHSWWSRLPGFLDYDTQHEDLLRLIAESGDAKLQLLILPAIEHHPTRERRHLLELLLNSKDEQVRAAAEAVRQRLQELEQIPLPHREILNDNSRTGT